MDAPDKRMCASADYYNEVYDYDCFGDILNGLDLPVDNLDGDGLAEDWASKLGPIPAEVFREILPDSGGGGGGGGLHSGCYLPNIETSQPKHTPILNERMFKSPTFFEEKKTNPLPRSFEAPSPDSVLERRTSGPTRNPIISFGIEIPIPVRTRTKRSRPRSTVNPWSTSPLLFPTVKQKKRRRHLAEQEQPINSLEIKKCTHCEITKTPQWREGPMGPKTLCNACGVRYRSGRLFPEYRPAASPTFIPSVHSNSHRKVIEMRHKGAAMDDNCVLLKKEHLGLNQTRNCSSE